MGVERFGGCRVMSKGSIRPSSPPASRLPSACCLLLTSSRMCLHLGIDSVRMGGGEWSGESVRGVDGLQGHGKGAWQCPVCLCSCSCSCLLLLALTQNAKPLDHHKHPHGDHMTISTTTGTYVATRTTISTNENNQDGGLWVAGALGVRRTARAGGARKWVVQWAC